KHGIARAMLVIMRARGRPPFSRETTMLDWLKQHRQTQNAIDRFWRVVLVSALNEQLDRTDAVYGIDVFWKAFLSNRDGFGVGVPAVPLERLYVSVANRIKGADGEVRMRCRAAGVCAAAEEMGDLRVHASGVLRDTV